jgi:threonine/homoserine/homoserine lactone efflux protein
MDPRLLARGLLIGLAIAAPVGPIGVLCIRRTLADGRLVGFITGLGAATVDAFYGSVAAFGLAFVANLLLGQRIWIHLLGGIFLVYLGVRGLMAQRRSTALSAVAPTTTRRGLAGAYLSTVLLTLTNPATIFSFAAIFAGVGLAGAHVGGASAGSLVLGVFLGSALWWMVLSSGVGLLRARLTPANLLWITRASALILLGFGVFAFATLRA